MSASSSFSLSRTFVVTMVSFCTSCGGYSYYYPIEDYATTQEPPPSTPEYVFVRAPSEFHFRADVQTKLDLRTNPSGFYASVRPPSDASSSGDQNVGQTPVVDVVTYHVEAGYRNEDPEAAWKDFLDDFNSVWTVKYFVEGRLDQSMEFSRDADCRAVSTRKVDEDQRKVKTGRTDSAGSEVVGVVTRFVVDVQIACLLSDAATLQGLSPTDNGSSFTITTD